MTAITSHQLVNSPHPFLSPSLHLPHTYTFTKTQESDSHSHTHTLTLTSFIYFLCCEKRFEKKDKKAKENAFASNEWVSGQSRRRRRRRIKGREGGKVRRNRESKMVMQSNQNHPQPSARAQKVNVVRKRHALTTARTMRRKCWSGRSRLGSDYGRLGQWFHKFHH